MKSLSRRAFVGGTGALVIAFHLPKKGRAAAAGEKTLRPNAFLRIGDDDTVTVLVPKSEMGQGVMTALPMVIAEELGAEFSRIRVEHAPAGKDYVMPMSFGMQITGGSTSVRGSWDTLRKAGASAKDLLERAAAKTWDADRAQCKAETGRVVGPGGKSATFGELVPAASKLSAKSVKPKAQKDFTLIGTSVPRTDVPMKTDGTAEFGMDVLRPGMLIATVLRCPVFGGTVRSFDAEKAKQVPGVKQVIALDHGVAVLAEGYYAALKGRKALEVKWDEGEHAEMSSDAIREAFAKAGEKKGEKVRNEGDAVAEIAAAPTKLSAIYDTPFLAHATMEPLNATAHVTESGCDVWSGTQNQSMAKSIAAKVTGLPKDAIRIHTMMLGGGFGRRGEFDFVEEAVRLAHAAKVPVKVIWSREDDMQHDFYRPLYWHKLEGAVDAKGEPSAWFHRLVGPSIVRRFLKIGSMISWDQDRGDLTWHDITSTDGARTLPYGFPNLRVEYGREESGVPIGFWRSVGNSFNAFVTECFFDELAAAAKKDPYELRLKLLHEEPRAAAVLKLAAEKAGWGTTPVPEGQGRGIAVHESFGSWVAMVAEVSVADDGAPRVHKVVCAVDCGRVVNPSIVEAQMESGIVYGLSAALRGKITVEKGRVKQGNFHDYPPLRMKEMPVVETHIVPSKETHGGVGEVAVPPIAPAVCNAIFSLTGKRVRSLPIDASLLAKA